MGDFNSRNCEMQRQQKIVNNLEGSQTMREPKTKIFLPSTLDRGMNDIEMRDDCNNFYEYGSDGEVGLIFINMYFFI